MTNAETYQEALKTAVKLRGLTYAELGERLGKDKASVYRSLSGKDLSITHLLEILAAIGMEPAEFYATVPTASAPKLDPPSLTPKQEKALRSDFRAFAVYWKMTVERLTPAEIKKEGELSDDKFKRIEATLAELGLDPKKPPIELKGAGALMAEIREEWTTRLLKRAMKEDANQPRITQVLLTPQAAKDLESSVRALHQTAITESQKTRAIPRKELKLVTVVTTTAEGSLVENYRSI